MPTENPEMIPDMQDPEEYGGLSVEDDPDGTIDPAELAGTRTDDDEDVAYEPDGTEGS